MYKVFFEDYIEKFWGIHPSQLDASFAIRRISRLDVLDFLKKTLTAITHLLHRKSSSHVSSIQRDAFIEPVLGSLYYNKHGGMYRVFEKFSEEIRNKKGSIFLNVRNIKVHITSQSAHSVSFEHRRQQNIIHNIDHLISTIPLQEFYETLQTQTKAVIHDAVHKMKYRALVVVALLIRKAHIMHSLLTYYRDLSFNRLTEPKNYGLQICPDNGTILLAEISCEVNDEIYKNDRYAEDLVVKDLIKEGIIQSRDEVIEMHVLKDKHAYPVFVHNYHENLNHIAQYLRRFTNIYSTGRQGMFQYVNQHVVMKMAEAVVKTITSEGVKKPDIPQSYYF